ncbi:hypothetical protein KAH81_10340 [bacterium]|nr:hypothetical protein [bacterium]
MKNHYLFMVTFVLVFASVIQAQTWVTLDQQFTDSSYSITVDYSDYDSTVLDISIPGNDTLTSDLTTSVDSVYARVGMDNALEYCFDYSAPGADSAQSVILEAPGFAVYYDDSDRLRTSQAQSPVVE